MKLYLIIAISIFSIHQAHAGKYIDSPTTNNDTTNNTTINNFYESSDSVGSVKIKGLAGAHAMAQCDLSSQVDAPQLCIGAARDENTGSNGAAVKFGKRWGKDTMINIGISGEEDIKPVWGGAIKWNIR